MASSGQVTLRTESVDYPCCPYGRGYCELVNIIGWSVDDNNDISFDLIDSYDNMGGYWYICKRAESAPYNIELVPQVSYDGGDSWEDLDVKRRVVTEVCGSGQVNTIAMSTTLINSLGTYHLDGNCQLRFLYYMTVNPNPDASYRWAFPNSSYSEVTQVPVVVEVSWDATMNYDSRGGSAVSPTTGTTTADSITLTVTNTVPTRTNYRFNGWSYGGNLYHGGDTITVQKSSPSITLVAQWDEFYRPGEHKVNGAWKSHNRSGGACERKVNGSWVELRTIDGGTGTTDPPSKKTNGIWYNQRKLGGE